MSIKVLISHAHDEKALAEAWKDLLKTVSLGGIEVWFSSDVNPGGGVDVGVEWREKIYQKLEDSKFVIAIQTPTSVGRPWIMWECGVASGIEKERRLIPIVFSMGRSELSSPLSSYQVYQGENEEQVKELCSRLVKETGRDWVEMVFDVAFKVYQDSINLHRPRKAIPIEQMDLWRTRFQELINFGRSHEVLEKRRTMYSTFGDSFKPIDPSLHELLSKIMLDNEHFDEAIEEIDYAISLVGEDIDLMHRKGLAFLHKHNSQEAEKIVNKLLQNYPNLQNNPELASLEGRIHRENWLTTKESVQLDKAFAAYYRAYEANSSQYYPGINAAELAFYRKDTELANEILSNILDYCLKIQQEPIVSYWVDFTIGQVYLGLGNYEEASKNYQIGLKRNPSPSIRDRKSALNGVRRMFDAKNLTTEDIEKIEQILSTNPQIQNK
jgi:tetratricopeptide (TPR) repeat protein